MTKFPGPVSYYLFYQYTHESVGQQGITVALSHCLGLAMLHHDLQHRFSMFNSSNLPKHLCGTFKISGKAGLMECGLQQMHLSNSALLLTRLTSWESG